jgi:hypothetical protein
MKSLKTKKNVEIKDQFHSTIRSVLTGQYSGRRGYRDISAPEDDSSSYDLEKYVVEGGAPSFGLEYFEFD